MKRNTLFYALLAMVLSFAASTQTFAKKAAKRKYAYSFILSAAFLTV